MRSTGACSDNNRIYSSRCFSVCTSDSSRHSASSACARSSGTSVRKRETTPSCVRPRNNRGAVPPLHSLTAISRARASYVYSASTCMRMRSSGDGTRSVVLFHDDLPHAFRLFVSVDRKLLNGQVSPTGCEQRIDCFAIEETLGPVAHAIEIRIDGRITACAEVVIVRRIEAANEEPARTERCTNTRDDSRRHCHIEVVQRKTGNNDRRCRNRKGFAQIADMELRIRHCDARAFN